MASVAAASMLASSACGLSSVSGPDELAQAATGTAPREVDGGAGYFGQWPSSFPTDPSFFPVGVWFESVTSASDVALDRDAGINTYVQLTENSDLALVAAAGMYAVHGITGSAGRETVGWLLADEVDMWAGAGDAPWTGRWPGQGAVCRPARRSCGYSVQRALIDALPPGRTRPLVANYGKGVTFWLDDDQAGRFARDFADVVSADNYWFTDENICGAGEGARLVNGGTEPLPPDVCHRASNYGLTIDRLRALTGGDRPVWAFVEVGHPASEDDWPAITPEQIRAAVWSSLIHGARGIVYFNHSFGGPNPTQHALREPAYAGARATVAQVNSHIRQLAVVLNAPSVTGRVRADDGLDVLVKVHGGALYLFAGVAGETGTGARRSVAGLPDGQADVLFEGRRVPITDGRLIDDFPTPDTVHIYRVEIPPPAPVMPGVVR